MAVTLRRQTANAQGCGQQAKLFAPTVVEAFVHAPTTAVGAAVQVVCIVGAGVGLM
jgi:hypothetical protein